MGRSISVGVRCRPLNAKELAHNEEACVSFPKLQSIQITHPHPEVLKPTDSPESVFIFDYIYDFKTTTPFIYRTLAAPIIDGLFDGLNGTILAYGQTGSGKTHTTIGYPPMHP